MAQKTPEYVRIIQKQANGSNTVTLPAELLRELKWKGKQKVTVKKRGEGLLVEVWKKPVVVKK
jgi:antitoxin component of MazEF toxin-antitoxin module